jgi:hypothetical protein
MSNYIVISEAAPEVVQVIEPSPQIVQVIEPSPDIVQVFSDLTINNIGGGTASDIVIKPPIPGLNAENVRDGFIEIIFRGTAFELDFAQSDLSIAGILPVVHNKNTLWPVVMVWDENGNQINPDGIIPQGRNAVGVVIKTYTPIVGIWKLKVET